MPDDPEDPMSTHTEALIDRLIQYLVGHVLPGGVVLFAIATGNPTVSAWFAGAQNGPTVMGFAFVILGALAVGFVVSALRYCVFEVLPLKWTCALVAAPPDLNEAQRATHDATYRDLRRNHYGHYLAGANLSIALPIGVALWKGLSPVPISWWAFSTVAILMAVSSVALAVGACSAIQRYDRKRIALIGERATAA